MELPMSDLVRFSKAISALLEEEHQTNSED